MSTAAQPLATPPSPASRRAAAAGVVAFLVIAGAGLTWAKWAPYAHRTSAILSTHAYPGHDVLAAAGHARSAPSLHGAWAFAIAYGKAIWQALLVALLVGAAIETLLPRAGLVRLMRGRGRRPATLTGGLCGLPSMMCTCCTAPVTAALRRSGVPTSSALAFWLANPLLNPAVLVFLAILLPWSWVATRIVIGVVVVFVATALIARLAPEDARAQADAPVDAVAPAPAPVRYARALARLTVTLVPEYLVAVLAIGLLRGWLFPLDGSAASWTAAAVVVAAILGTLVVIPTGGELPILIALLGAGVGSGVLGALLITLPAISLPSMLMVGRALSWRVTLAAAGAVSVAGLAGGALLWALPG